MSPPAFKPSQVVLTVPPLTGTLKRSEVECAAALIVYVCTVKGDAWQPMTFADLHTALRSALASKERTVREQWICSMVENPFVRPDVHALVDLGFAERLSKDGEKIVVQLQPAALDAIATRWVRS
ncbi:MAG TPA: hypothetical protein VGE37_03195 [Archangium sp.]